MHYSNPQQSLVRHSLAWPERREKQIAVPLMYQVDGDSIVPVGGERTLKAIDELYCSN
jgi:hypothetical protein